MIGDIVAAFGRIRGAVSAGFEVPGVDVEGVLHGRGRRVLVVVLVLVLVSLSGYLAAASGVAVESTLGGNADGATTSSGGAGSPQGLVGTSAVGEPDADGDALTDRAEREDYGTDPGARDTDGDGISDGMEVGCTGAYPDADPLQQDVYVELDSVEGADLSKASVAKLREAFANAPVDNPGGESGIAFHVVRSDVGLAQGESVNDDPRQGPNNDVEEYRDAHFQRNAAGYYYVLVSTNAAYNGDAYYAGAGKPGTAVVESYDRNSVMASLVIHEMGHAFGIDGGQRGVDARKYSNGEYHSVMNYNALYDITTYSNGTDAVGRDEWDYVANSRHIPDISTAGGSVCPAIEGGETTGAQQRG